MTARLVVVGGGYVGAEVARRLDPHLDVVLIEPREVFVHTPATIRALVQPGLLDAALMPYDRLLKRGRIVQGRAVRVHPEGVTLADGSEETADVILVATGSTYGGPFKPRGDSIPEFRAAHAKVAAEIGAARNVVIIGAGPVGIELAGEIGYARPGTPVTLISAGETLMPEHPPRLGRSLEAKLIAMGMRVLKGRRVAETGLDPVTGRSIARMTDGEELAADLAVSATGASAVTGLLSSLPGARLGDDGRVATDPWLRPSGMPNVFAGGDAVGAGDAMTIVATMRQVPFLVRTIRAVASGRSVERLRPYRPWTRAPILLPLGPRIGSSYLPLPGNLGVTGNLVTRQMKGADLFIPKYRRFFGLGK